MENSINIYQKAKKRLGHDLNLESGDQYSQDWEYEVADSSRIDEFSNYYSSNKLNPVEKKILINILLESYNDYAGIYGLDSSHNKTIKDILKNERDLCVDIIQIWSCEGENLEDSFYITPLIREIAKEI